MPCRQVSTFNGTTGSGQSGGGGYTTEADCLNACKEGACCEGTTCTVKPQCQCKCATNSCCGPDIVTVGGITGPACRGGTEAECAARGGVWRPCKGCAADANLPGTPYPCQPSDTPPAFVPVFRGVGTTCSPNPCRACSECTASHPTYLAVTFSQTAPISGGFHESLINLSGTYSLPSVTTSSTACAFRGTFIKTYSNAITNQFGTFDLNVEFTIQAVFASQSASIAIGMAGASLNAGDTQDRGPSLYQFTVCTGQPLGGPYSFASTIPLGASQQMTFPSCSGNSHAANRFGYTNVFNAGNQFGSPYQIQVNTNTSVQCGTFSWSGQ
jgi:hypothetical protein